MDNSKDVNGKIICYFKDEKLKNAKPLGSKSGPKLNARFLKIKESIDQEVKMPKTKIKKNKERT